MFQHPWSSLISVSVTLSNYRTNNQVSIILIAHMHTQHTQTHTTHVYTLHTHTHTHTYTQASSSLRTGTLSFLFQYPSPCPRQGLAPGRYPTAVPRVLLPWTSRLISAPTLCALCYSPCSHLSICFRAGVMPVLCSSPPVPSHFYLK